MRINRYLARAGLGSRRGVEAYILAGRIRINDSVSTDLSQRIDPETDIIHFDKLVIKLPDNWRVYMFHKPRGVVSTLVPQDARPCLLKFRDEAQLDGSVIPVGRLDYQSSGLLIWTNDGFLSQQLCTPATGVWKVYELLLSSSLPENCLSKLRDGKIELDGRPCLPAKLDPMAEGGLKWRISIHEGRNRQIRRMMEYAGSRVRELHRVTYGPLELGDLSVGQFRELTENEIDLLHKAIAIIGDS